MEEKTCHQVVEPQSGYFQRGSLDRVIAKGNLSVPLSVCHTGEPRLNGPKYLEIWFAPYDRAMFLVS